MPGSIVRLAMFTQLKWKIKRWKKEGVAQKTCMGEDRNSGIAQKCNFFIWRPPLSFWQSDCPRYTHPSHATILLIRFLSWNIFLPLILSSSVSWCGLVECAASLSSASWMSSSFFLWQRFWDWVNMVQSMQFHTQPQNVVVLISLWHPNKA